MLECFRCNFGFCVEKRVPLSGDGNNHFRFHKFADQVRRLDKMLLEFDSRSDGPSANYPAPRLAPEGWDSHSLFIRESTRPNTENLVQHKFHLKIQQTKGY